MTSLHPIPRTILCLVFAAILVAPGAAQTLEFYAATDSDAAAPGRG